MGKYKHRLLGVCVLFLMAALTIGTTVSFAGNERSGSYTLTIQKVFDTTGMTPKALEEAEKLTYTFRVAAQVKSGGEYVPVEEIVKITGAHEKTIEFDNAFKISVIEQTDPGGFKINGKEWNVTNTLCESTMHVGASQATLDISRDNGTITVTRPADSPTVTFQLTGESFHHGSGLAPGTGEPPSEDDDKKPDDQDPEAKSNENSDEGEKSATPETGEGQGDQSDNSNEAGVTEGQQAVEPDKPDEPDKSNEPETAAPQGGPGTEPTEPDEAIAIAPQSQQGDETGDGDEQEETPAEPKAEEPEAKTPEEPKVEGSEIPPLPVQSNVVKPILPRSEDDHGNNNNKFTFNSGPITVEAGKEVTLGERLERGKYTITKLRAEDGFRVLVGEREFPVAAGGTGTVYINGSDSKITIKAPDPVNGVVRTHHYRVYKDGRQVRDIDVLSGDTGAVEHLDEGKYTIKVYETYSGIKGYTVKYPYLKQTANRQGTIGSVYTGSSGNYSSFTVRNNADCVEVYGFGPMLNASGKQLTGTGSYKFYFGTRNPETGKVEGGNSTVTNTNWGSRSFNTTKKLFVPENDGKVYFLALKVSNSNAESLTVKWKEYKKEEESSVIKKPESTGNLVTVDGLKDNYITISKADDLSERGSEVKYYYTIQNSDGDLITDFTVTDENGNAISVPTNETFNGKKTTVTLKAGQTVKINGLKAGGNYRIFESVEEAPAMGFGVKLEDTKKSVTTPKGSIEITTLGERVVKISRPGDPADDNHRVYTYNIYKTGQADVYHTIKLKAGEEATGYKLPPGSYRIKAMDDEIVGFDVTYTDSSSITSDFVRSATVTFTNHFAEVQASYHVIHEYYLKNADGSYTFEGVSPVFTKNCERDHDEGDGHYAKDVHQMEVYNGNTYTHIAEGGDAYGKVVSWPKGTNAVEVPLDEGTDIPYTTGPFVKEGTGSNGTGSEDDPGTRDYAYVPLTNLTFATATAHNDETGIHDGGAQIIILRYYREAKPVERGKYNVIHVYYQRTDKGDKWEGSSELETIDIGNLTNDNRYKTYDADGVEKKLHFTPKDSEKQYPYVYDGAAYGRIVNSDKTEDYDGEGTAGNGKEYRKDDVMTSVKATPEGDQIIILRYYRSGGYRIVHEYYYREKMEGAEDSGSVEETPGGMEEIPGGGEETPEEMEPMLLALGDDQPTEDSGFNGTLTDSGGYAYDFEGKSEIDALTADLESRHDANEVDLIKQFQPVGEEQTYTYTYIDAVYGYCDKETGLYRVAPYMTGVTATDQEDEIIILRYCRGDVDQPETPPDKPDKPSGSGSTPTPPKDPETPAIPEKPTEPEPPTEPENPGGPDDPKPPTDPSRPTTLPDPNQPGSPNQVTIWENGVPTTYVKLWDPEKEKWVYIPETKVPTTGKGTPTTTTIPRISRVPKTGDAGGPWGALIAAALSGFGALRLPFWKKKD